MEIFPRFDPELSKFPGSFGLWGSLLAGGDVIAAKGTSNLTLSEEDRVYLSSGRYLQDSHWSSSYITGLSLVQSFIYSVDMPTLFYAIKNQE